MNGFMEAKKRRETLIFSYVPLWFSFCQSFVNKLIFIRWNCFTPKESISRGGSVILVVITDYTIYSSFTLNLIRCFIYRKRIFNDNHNFCQFLWVKSGTRTFFDFSLISPIFIIFSHFRSKWIAHNVWVLVV